MCTITSGGALTFVTVGTCTINADQPGNGAYLPAPQVSRSFTVSPVVPGAPTIGTAIAGDAQATVEFTPPAFTGGSAITGYTVTANPGGATAMGGASPVTFTGLTNGTTYTFMVTASNAAGTGVSSTASNAVTPRLLTVSGTPQAWLAPQLRRFLEVDPLARSRPPVVLPACPTPPRRARRCPMESTPSSPQAVRAR